MAEVINFSQKGNKNKTANVTQTAPVAGSLKYVAKKNLPASDSHGSLILTDTGELYAGGGAGNPLQILSDILVLANEEAFPLAGDEQKLYISRSSKTAYFWDGSIYEVLAGGTGTGDTGVLSTRIIECDNVAGFPSAGVSNALYVAKDKDTVYRFDTASKTYIQLSRPVTDSTTISRVSALETAMTGKADNAALALKADVAALVGKADVTALAAKADKTELLPKADKTELANYRKVADKIGIGDVDDSVAAKLNQTYTPYDDTAVRSDITTLQNNKADKTTLAGYRKTADKITVNDLEATLADKVNEPPYDDTTVKADITALQTEVGKKADATALASKADTTLLANYRKTADAIKETDLEPAVQDKINAPGYDDTAVKADISALQTGKADVTALADKANKSDLANYRKTADAIGETDLDPTIVSKLNTAAAGYDDTAIKADVAGLHDTKMDKTALTAALTGYRKTTDPIQATDLDPAITDQINTIQTDLGKKADQTAVTDQINTAVASKADASTVAAIQTAVASKADASTVTALADTVATKADAADLAAKADVSTVNALKTTVDSKASSSDLAALQSTVNDNANTVNNLTTTVSGKADVSSVSDLQTQLQSALTRITALETQVNPPAPSTHDISSLAAIADVSVAYGTAFNSLGLPTAVTATLDDSSTTSCAVTWAQGSYDPNTAGTYAVSGTISLPAYTTNSQNLAPTVNVTVQAQVVSGDPTQLWSYEFTLEGPGATAVTLGSLPNWDPANVFTIEDFYGPATDGKNKTVEVRFIGWDVNRLYDPDGVPHPTSIETDAIANKISPDGAVDYDDSLQRIDFASGSMGNRVYKLVKWSQPITR